MAAVFLAHNGIGLGHFSRASAFCDHLQRFGHRPLLVAQTESCPKLACDSPVRFVKPLWDCDQNELTALVANLTSHLRIGSSRLLYEDTLPSDVEFPSDIRRQLLVRPTTFPFLHSLLTQYSTVYERFLICDSPGSPTWPYDETETQELLKNKSVLILGRVSRTATPAQIAFVRRKYSIAQTAPVCVFSLGGGGEHHGTDDVRLFLEAATEIGQSLKSADTSTRLVFVKGPLFSSGASIPNDFEIVEQEPLMPALLSCARAAVIRPGFNTTWECIDAGIPFVPILGTSYEEPIAARVETLLTVGAAISDLSKHWTNNSFFDSRTRVLHEISSRFPPLPTESTISFSINDSRSADEHAGDDMESPPAEAARILLHTINGVGIGHTIRTARLARLLTQAGFNVSMLVETSAAQPNVSDIFPYECIPRLPPNKRFGDPSQYLAAITKTMSDFDPHVIVYDCHRPMHELLSSRNDISIRFRLALASMPSEEMLNQLTIRDDADLTLLLHSEAEFAAMYGESTLARIKESARFQFLGGPLLSSDTRSQVCREDDAIPAEPFVLFLLGGGGEHEGKTETSDFTAIVNNVASHIHSVKSLNTVFVAGPLYHSNAVGFSEFVQFHSYVHNLSRLVESAEVVVIRPGFNLSREVFSKAKRLIAVRMHQFAEASEENLRLITNRPNSEIADLTADSILQGVKRLVDQPVVNPPPTLWGNGNESLVAAVAAAVDTSRTLNRLTKSLSRIRRTQKRVVIRIDDVCDDDETLRSLIATVLAENASCSLEVIPKLCSFDESTAGGWVNHHDQIEVSQHGILHLPSRPSAQRKCEFNGTWELPSDDDLNSFETSFESMRQFFPRLFRGGYSAPYDSLPEWIPAAWKAVGGEYISVIWANVRWQHVPVVRCGVDVWDWSHNHFRSTESICADILDSVYERGLAGIVLHPQHFVEFQSLSWLANLLRGLRDGGVSFVLPSEIATKQSERAIVSEMREYSFQATTVIDTWRK